MDGMSRRDRPSALDLIAESRRTLAEAVIPALQGEARLAALMAASALGMAERELRATSLDAALAGPSAVTGAPDEAALAALIRSGKADGSGALHAALVGAGRARLAVAKPQLLELQPPDLPSPSA